MLKVPHAIMQKDSGKNIHTVVSRNNIEERKHGHKYPPARVSHTLSNPRHVDAIPVEYQVPLGRRCKQLAAL